MTELLSREQEFLKLNEELDRIATSTALKEQQQHHHNHQQHQQQQQQQKQKHPTSYINTLQTGKDDQRFQTYTRNKGPSTLLGKRADMRGAGDCGSVGDASVEIPSCPQKNQSRVNQGLLTARDYNRKTRATKPNGAFSPGTPTQAAGPSSSMATRQDDDTVSIAESRKGTFGYTASTGTTATRSKQIKSPEITTRTYSRTSNRANNPTFTIRYRNPKFVESPSLEVLVKDESAAIRQEKPSKTNLTYINTDSFSSVNTDTGPSNARTSTGGNKTKQISTDGLIKFLKSRIAILEEDHDRITQDMAQQKELLEKTLEHHKKVEQQRDQAYSKQNTLTDQLSKVESQLEESNRRIKERASDQNNQQKEIEMVRRELKLLTQTNTNLEKRLYRANEELENTKNALTIMKNTERELRETIRIEGEGKEKQIKSLKKQRADLLNAYKKQLFLIDNLKRQNICMEQSKMISFGEKDFNKVLEWNTKT